MSPVDRARTLIPCLSWHESQHITGAVVGMTSDAPFVEMSATGVLIDDHNAIISAWNRTIATVPLIGETWPARMDWLRRILPTVARELKTRHDDPDAQRVARLLQRARGTT